MNDFEINEPELMALESRLSGAAPALLPADQYQLLYQCAFEAGRTAESQRLRRGVRQWQTVAAGLLLFCCGLAISHVNSRHQVATEKTHLTPWNSGLHAPTPDLTPPFRSSSPIPSPQSHFDAWQAHPPIEPDWEIALVHHKDRRSNRHEDSVESLTRLYLE